jgi:hypothetical protein
LLDAEAVRSSVCEPRFVNRVAVEQRMGTDEDADVVVGEPWRCTALGRGRTVREQLHPHGPVTQQRALGADRQAFEGFTDPR